MTIYLTNTPVVLPAEGIVYQVSRISVDTAFFALDEEGFTSAIGHQGTVDVLKTIFPGLAATITMNRIEIKEPSSEIVFKLKGRLPEGKILNKDEIEAIGYEFWSVTPIKEKKPVIPEQKIIVEPAASELIKCPTWIRIDRPKRKTVWKCACGYIYPPDPERKSPDEIRQEREDEHSRVMF